jgi:hypothetical protein
MMQFIMASHFTCLSRVDTLSTLEKQGAWGLAAQAWRMPRGPETSTTAGVCDPAAYAADFSSSDLVSQLVGP